MKKINKNPKNPKAPKIPRGKDPIPQELRNPHHLRKRGRKGIWWLRYKPHVSKKTLHSSLRTSDLRVAMSMRDKIIGELRIEASKVNLARLALANLIDADQLIKQDISKLAPKYYENTVKGERISDLIDPFIQSRRKIRQITVQSAQGYRRAISHFIEIVGDKPISAVSPSDVENFVMNPGENQSVKKSTDSPKRPLSPRTVFTRYGDLTAFFTWASRQRHINANPFLSVDKPFYKKNNTKSPPFELADALCSIQKPETSSLSNETWEVLPLFLRYTGSRIGEACQIKASDIYKDNDMLIMRIKAEKTQRRIAGALEYKEVPVHPKLRPKIEMLMEKRSEGFLFFDAGKTAVFEKDGSSEDKFGAAFRKAWGTPARKIWKFMKPHSWRSYVIDVLKNSGVPEDVRMDIVGHSRGSVHRDYASRFPNRVLYEAICKLP